MSNNISLYRLSPYRVSRVAIDTRLEMGIVVLGQLRNSQYQWKHWSNTQIEQDASVVVGLYRDEYYNEDTEYKGLLELGVLKNRKGRIGVVPMKFIGEIQLVKDIEKGEYK